MIRRCWSAAVFTAALASPVAAEDFEARITGPAAGLEVVEVYRDQDAETLAGKLSSDSFPLPVLAISENLMLFVQHGSAKGWVYPFHVKANFDPGDVGPCNYNITTGEAAPRAIGRNCENAKKN